MNMVDFFAGWFLSANVVIFIATVVVCSGERYINGESYIEPKKKRLAARIALSAPLGILSLVVLIIWGAYRGIRFLVKTATQEV